MLILIEQPDPAQLGFHHHGVRCTFEFDGNPPRGEAREKAGVLNSTQFAAVPTGHDHVLYDQRWVQGGE